MAWQLPHASGVPGLLVRVCRARILDVIMLKSAEFVEVVEVDFETLPAVLDPLVTTRSTRRNEMYLIMVIDQNRRNRRN